MNGVFEPAAVVVIIIAIGAVFVRLSELEKRLGAIQRLDAKLDALLEHAGIQFDPLGRAPQEVVQALERGQKIEAIKHYRQATGAGLKEAKEIIEDLQRRMSNGA